MSRINLTKNKAALEKAWTDLHNPSSENDWVVFGYDGKTFDLKIVETGDGGFEEMVEELNSGKIMYAGCRVNDPNTNLPKIVFINWQGEGVPTNVKGTCANHLRDVTNMFKGAHVTVNARSEDDLDYDTVLEKVKKSSGANYSIHKEKPKPMEKIKPVGTAYKRINPTAEIDVGKRDTFWQKQHQDEQVRQEQEKVTAIQEREAEEKKRREREAREASARDEAYRERSRSIDQQRAAQRALEQKRKEEEKKKYEATLKDAQKDDEEFRKRSDSERRRRLQEAQSMIKSRQISMDEEKKRFDQPPPQQKAPPPVIPKKTIRKPVPAPVQEPVPVEQQAPEVVEREVPREAPREPEPEPVVETFHDQPTVQETEPDNFYETVDNNVPQTEDNTVSEPVTDTKEPEISHDQEQDNFYDAVHEEQQPHEQEPGKEEDNLYDNVTEDVPSQSEPATATTPGIVVRAVYDYQAEGDDEITFDPGDIITNVDCFDAGWWKGTAPNGHFGLFPSNYVEIVSEKEEAQPQEVRNEPESDAAASQGLRARALYDYQAADDSEITFDPDDIITNIEQIDEGWWRGTAPSGDCGLFPANYVELI